MDSQPSDDTTTEPRFGPLVYLGLPCALQVAALYVLIAVDTPFRPLALRLVRTPWGILVLAAFGLASVSVIMWAVTSWAAWRHKKNAR
jgi:hypothetical protein